MGKLGNTLAMLKILENGRKYTVGELSEKIEVSPRMIKEYKIELEKAGIYIDSLSGKYGGYVYSQKNNYEVSFSIKDVNALEKVLLKLNPEEKPDIEQVLEKLKTIVIYSDTSTIKKDINSEETKHKYNIISKAINNLSSISFEYRNKQRILEPHNFSFYKDYIYITGFSKTDNDLRTYNLTEINFK